MHRKKAVVVGIGHGNELTRAAIAKLLQDNGIVVDGRNVQNMTIDTIKGVVAVAKRRGNPVFVQQGEISPYLKALGSKGYWMFRPRGQNAFAFWFIDGTEAPPAERLITV